MLTTCHWTGALYRLYKCTVHQWWASGQKWHTQQPGCTSVPSTPWTSTSRPALPLLLPSLHPLKVRTLGRDVSETQRILAARENLCQYFKHSRNIPVTCDNSPHSSIVKFTLNQHTASRQEILRLKSVGRKFSSIMDEVMAS